MLEIRAEVKFEVLFSELKAQVHTKVPELCPITQQVREGREKWKYF